MREPGTITLSSEELKRGTVLSDCTQGRLTCARAAALLGISLRHCKRLKRRYRQSGAAALAHVNRGRPSPRRLPEPVRQRILRLAHHLCRAERSPSLRKTVRAARVGSEPGDSAPPAARGRLVGLDLVEVNPYLDHAELTQHIAVQITIEAIATRVAA